MLITRNTVGDLCPRAHRGTVRPRLLRDHSTLRDRVAGVEFSAKDCPVLRCTACYERGKQTGKALFHVESGVAIAFTLAIARDIAQRGPANAATFEFFLGALPWTIKYVAGVLGVDVHTVRAWRDGRRPLDRLAWAVLAAVVWEATGEVGRYRMLARLRAINEPGIAPDQRIVKFDPGGGGWGETDQEHERNAGRELARREKLPPEPFTGHAKVVRVPFSLPWDWEPPAFLSRPRRRPRGRSAAGRGPGTGSKPPSLNAADRRDG